MKLPKRKSSSLTHEQATSLEVLLDLVRKDGGYFPTIKSFQLFLALTSKWAVEMVILRKLKGKLKILLTIYDGGEDQFKGKWHIPGGYYFLREDSYEEIAWRLSEAELGQLVKPVEAIGLPYFWKLGEHPNGRPLSIFTYCTLVGKIEETEKCRFFSIFNLPDNMVGVHRNWLEQNVPLLTSKY